MISKQIFVSMIVLISLIQFITCPTATRSTDPTAPKTRVEPRSPLTSKSGVGKSRTTATNPTEPGMDPDDDTAMESGKPNGLRQKLLKPIKLIFFPLRFLWRKFKNLKDKAQKNYNKETEFDGEKPI